MACATTTIQLSNGQQLTLEELRAWDAVLFRRRFGRNMEALGLKPEELSSAGLTVEEFSSFQFEALLFLGWRCAVAAGSKEKTEEEFWSGIPMQDFPRVTSGVAGFFSKGPECNS